MALCHGSPRQLVHPHANLHGMVEATWCSMWSILKLYLDLQGRGLFLPSNGDVYQGWRRTKRDGATGTAGFYHPCKATGIYIHKEFLNTFSQNYSVNRIRKTIFLVFVGSQLLGQSGNSVAGSVFGSSNETTHTGRSFKKERMGSSHCGTTGSADSLQHQNAGSIPCLA